MDFLNKVSLKRGHNRVGIFWMGDLLLETFLEEKFMRFIEGWEYIEVGGFMEDWDS